MPYTTHNGVKIYWNEYGMSESATSGDPLLLINGLGYSSDMWHRLIPALMPHYRIIVLDNRGVGRSDVPPGPYPIATMAADAAAVLDAARIGSARVFGISMGGMIAQEFALQYPERVQSLILGCTHCGGAFAVPPSMEVLAAMTARATMPAEQGVRLMLPYIYDASTPQTRIEEDLVIRQRTFPTPEGYLAQLQGIALWSSYDRLGRIIAPTLVIHGETDQLVPPANGRILAKRIRGAELLLLPHASHIFFTDQPELTIRAIRDFLG